MLCFLLRALFAVLALTALPAAAQARSAHLLEGADSPLLAAPLTDLRHAESLGWGEHFAKTFAISVVATSGGLALGSGLGSLSNQLGVAAAGTLLSNLIVGPVLTVVTALVVGDGRLRNPGFWGPLAVAMLVNAALFALTSLVPVFAVSWANPAANLVYSLVDGLLMTSASVGLLHRAAP
jgi:hypothetical protein